VQRRKDVRGKRKEGRGRRGKEVRMEERTALKME
jgi:hypothetical protein